MFVGDGSSPSHVFARANLLNFLFGTRIFLGVCGFTLFAVCEDFFFLVCAMTFCLQCGIVLCQELEFLFAVHFIFRDEQLFVICG